ncbi:hypothetical protein [Dysgonomonas sp. 520]|uniref:hypothetical protein n=1 Tax=Dysgonomonas sp. 520 TaxID=2302931 RepID=UPI0013D09C87|nr:hypothetical protein [Dysgonomonas sp. 520]NDW10052.1 hypothetical protein [Dysgonomonas sp. 520]
MLKYLLVAIIAAIIPFISLIFRKVRDGYNKNDILSLVFTFFISFSGLFFAIFLTGLSEKDKEKEDVIKLLEVSKLEIQRTLYLSRAAMVSPNMDLEHRANSINFYAPVRKITFTSNVLNNELVLRTLSSTSLEHILNVISSYDNNFERTFEFMKEDVNNEKWYRCFQGTCVSLYHLHRAIDNEIELIKGDIDKEELKNRYSSPSKTDEEIINQEISKIGGEFRKDIYGYE